MRQSRFGKIWRQSLQRKPEVLLKLLARQGSEKIIPKRPEVFFRTAEAVATISSGVKYAAPMKPSAPAFDTAATSLRVSPAGLQKSDAEG
jgi:hypothetical protein